MCGGRWKLVYAHQEHVGGKLKINCVLIIGSGACVVGALKIEVSLLIGTMHMG